MKKKVVLLLLTSAVLTSALAGCGRKNTANNTNENKNNVTSTEQITNEERGTEAVLDTENNATSQLHLGNAVEIPEGWEGQLAETAAHEQLEKVIADYCGVAKENYANVRYYYNYVDLNGDSKNEILALVLGNENSGLNENTLLWIDAENETALTKDHVKQAFKNVGAPVFVSNHMTEGHRDLIIAENTHAAANGTGTAANGTTGTTTNDTTANGTTTGTATNDTTANNGTAGATRSTDSATTTKATNQTTNNGTANAGAAENATNAAEAVSTGTTYRLLVWTGEKYQDVQEGTLLEDLKGHEGTAILTNNMESDLANDNYHFLGEAMR